MRGRSAAKLCCAIAVALGLNARPARAIPFTWDLSGTIGDVVGPDAAVLNGLGVVAGAPFQASFRLESSTVPVTPGEYVGAVLSASFGAGSYAATVAPFGGGTVSAPPGGDTYIAVIAPPTAPLMDEPLLRLTLTHPAPPNDGSLRIDPPIGAGTQLLFEVLTGPGPASILASSFAIAVRVPEPGALALLLVAAAAARFASTRASDSWSEDEKPAQQQSKSTGADERADSRLRGGE